ncbi:MAG: peptidase T [Rikenellaceae bacterium]|nr:peptidase T [Rikenellaceae bacterium]
MPVTPFQLPDDLRERLTERFIRYAQIDTQSDPASETYPSTARQLRLLNLLVEELLALGLADVEIDEHGYVTATIAATTRRSDIPPIGFIAHADTSPEVSGAHVSPRVIDYAGGGITVNTELGLTVDADRLEAYRGDRLIFSDGTTLLGADDKAGIAEIVTAAEYLVLNPQIEHGTIRLAFTPDEEVGRGTEYFDVGAFGARYAYTVDGGAEGSLEYETFNAAEARIVATGINTHPGAAKDLMVNSQLVMMELLGELPADERPETTSGREGFFHLIRLCGNVEQTEAELIVRDHDRCGFIRRKHMLTDLVDAVNRRYGRPLVNAVIRDQYYNMGEQIAPHGEVIEIAREAMRLAGVEPRTEPVRGGTDGSRLSFLGLPCPNLFAGGENIHSRTEFVSERVMTRATEVIVNICRLFCDKPLEK